MADAGGDRGGFGRGRGRGTNHSENSLRDTLNWCNVRKNMVTKANLVFPNFQAVIAEEATAEEDVDADVEIKITRTSGFLSLNLAASLRKERSSPSRKSSFSHFLSRNTR